jgi:tetratricopeptide (TPR) repeat protein
MMAEEFSELEALLDARDYKKALAYLTSLDQNGPKRASVQYHLGFVNRQLENFDEAVRLYEAAIRLEPTTALFFLALGIALQQQHNFEAALRAIEKAIELQPDYVNAWNSLGLTHKMAGEIHSALAAYKRAQEFVVSAAHAQLKERRSEGIPTPVLESGQKGALLTADYFEELKRILRADLLYATISNNIGGCYLELGRYDEAKGAFMESIEFIPDGTSYEPPHVGLRRIYDANQ